MRQVRLQPHLPIARLTTSEPSARLAGHGGHAFGRDGDVFRLEVLRHGPRLPSPRTDAEK